MARTHTGSRAESPSTVFAGFQGASEGDRDEAGSADASAVGQVMACEGSCRRFGRGRSPCSPDKSASFAACIRLTDTRNVRVVGWEV